jgi:integrase
MCWNHTGVLPNTDKQACLSISYGFERPRAHTFRHFFATKLYLQTRDIHYVQKKMGHRSITSTTIYENSEPNQNVETYITKAITTGEEAEKLIALGYEFHYHAQDGVDIFRKKVVGLD